MTKFHKFTFTSKIQNQAYLEIKSHCRSNKCPIYPIVALQHWSYIINLLKMNQQGKIIKFNNKTQEIYFSLFFLTTRIQ